LQHDLVVSSDRATAAGVCGGCGGISSRAEVEVERKLHGPEKRQCHVVQGVAVAVAEVNLVHVGHTTAVVVSMV